MWLLHVPAPGIYCKDRTSLDLTRKLIVVVGDPYSPFFRILGAMPTLTLVNRLSGSPRGFRIGRVRGWFME